MPALARLIEGGVRGNLATLQPVLSPMLWTSIATGKRADRHGIRGFTEPLADGSGIGPVRSTSRKCKAIWNIFTQSELKSNVVGWFATHPAEPINGVMLSDNYLRGPASPGTVYPPELAAEAADWFVPPASLAAEDILPFIPRLREIDLAQDDRPYRLARRLARAASVQAAATALIQTRPWNLMCVYYDAIDQFGHEFMPYHPPQLPDVSEREFELYKDVMTGCYRFHDMMLHSLLQYVDDQTTVILVSDHGYQSGGGRPQTEAGRNDPEGCHRAFGIVCLKGPNIKRGERIYGASILDVTPTILALAGLPLGADMDGRPWLETFVHAEQPERIFSWEGIADGKAGLHKAEDRQDPAEAAEAVRQLVELGYIAEPGADAQKNIRDTIRCNKTHLVRALIGTPRVAQAVPILRELLEETPGDPWCVLTLARMQIGLRRLPEAHTLLDSLDAATRESPDVQLLRAELAFAEEQPDVALRHMEAARLAGGSHPLICNQVGRGYIRLGRWDEAAAVFQQSLRAEPENPAALDGMAQVHLHHGDPARAVESALEAIGLIHFFPEAHLHLATALEACGKAPEAIAAFETALGMGCPARPIHERLAVLYRETDPERAGRHQRAAKAKKPRVYRANISPGFPGASAEPGGSGTT